MTKRTLACAASAALALTALAPAVGANAADPEPANLLTASPLPTWQTDGAVYAVEHANGVVYVGGNFTAVRPPGAAPGQNEVPRHNLAAFDAQTGNLLPFSHDFDSDEYPIPADGSYDKTCSLGSTAGTYTCDTIYEIRMSPDGSSVFVGGDFMRVDGQDRRGLAEFANPSGQLTDFRIPRVNGRVRALAVSDQRLYFGGGFTSVDGRQRERLAAADRSTSTLTAWAPPVDDKVITMALAPDSSRVIIGGDFDTVNGVPIHGLAAVDAQTGENVRWDSRAIPDDGDRSFSRVTDLDFDSDTVYVSAEGIQNFDGRLALDPYTGQVRWIDGCKGATWSVEVIGEVLYSGSHAHDCTSIGGFPETNRVDDLADKHYHRLLAESARGPSGPALFHWFPTTNGGVVGSLGPRDMAQVGETLWVVGEFTTVNKVPQQGLTRFAPEGLGSSYQPDRPEPPALMSTRPGEVEVVWEATSDLDDENLTYTLYRGSSPTLTGTVVHTTTASSKPYWVLPTMSFTDTGLTPGAQYSYQVRATDNSGQASGKSYIATVTVTDHEVAYPRRVLADGATTYWPLDDPGGRVATDFADQGQSGRYTSTGITYRSPGAIKGAPARPAVQTDGVTGMVRGFAPAPSRDTFSAELWFKTTSTSGGKLLGYGSENHWLSFAPFDRHVYMGNAGLLAFGVQAGTKRVVRTAASYNDGAWHHVVATLGPGGMRLYVDGALRASDATVTNARDYAGYWRLGGDNLAGWPLKHSSNNFAGHLDEFAVYPTQLTRAQITAHYNLGRG